MRSDIGLLHNDAFQPEELIALFDLVGFYRLGEWQLESIEDIFKHTDYYVIARLDDRLVGFVPLLTDWHTRGYVSNLCATPSHQHAGIGTALMGEILGVCDERRISVLNVYDTSDEPGFYEQFGFGSDRKAKGLHRLCPAVRRGTDH